MSADSNGGISPGVCPVCGTYLDHEEIRVGTEWFEAFCCVCSRYVRKRWKPLKGDWRNLIDTHG